MNPFAHRGGAPNGQRASSTHESFMYQPPTASGMAPIPNLVQPSHQQHSPNYSSSCQAKPDPFLASIERTVQESVGPFIAQLHQLHQITSHNAQETKAFHDTMHAQMEQRIRSEQLINSQTRLEFENLRHYAEMTHSKICNLENQVAQLQQSNPPDEVGQILRHDAATSPVKPSFSARQDTGTSFLQASDAFQGFHSDPAFFHPSVSTMSGSTLADPLSVRAAFMNASKLNMRGHLEPANWEHPYKKSFGSNMSSAEGSDYAEDPAFNQEYTYPTVPSSQREYPSPRRTPSVAPTIPSPRLARVSHTMQTPTELAVDGSFIDAAKQDRPSRGHEERGLGSRAGQELDENQVLHEQLGATSANSTTIPPHERQASPDSFVPSSRSPSPGEFFSARGTSPPLEFSSAPVSTGEFFATSAAPQIQVEDEDMPVKPEPVLVEPNPTPSLHRTPALFVDIPAPQPSQHDIESPLTEYDSDGPIIIPRPRLRSDSLDYSEQQQIAAALRPPEGGRSRGGTKRTLPKKDNHYMPVHPSTPPKRRRTGSRNLTSRVPVSSIAAPPAAARASSKLKPKKNPQRQRKVKIEAKQPALRTPKVKIEANQAARAPEVQHPTWPLKPQWPAIDLNLSARGDPNACELMICCDICERWLHFTCVNESPTDPKHANGNFELICPWCKPDPDVARRAVSFGVPLSEKEKETCSRPSCTIASHTVGRIMGRTKKGCESVFLVFWNLYELKDCTWEPESNIDRFAEHVDGFRVAVDMEGQDFDKDDGPLLLKEALDFYEYATKFPPSEDSKLAWVLNPDDAYRPL